MAEVATVRGSVDTAELGRTYVHEHIFTLTPDVQQNYPDEWGDEETRVADAARQLRALADAGFLLGMDRFGINLDTTFEARADTVVEMCRRGYAGSMVLSHDASCHIDWIDPAALAQLPQWHYLHIGEDVLPYLRAHGVSEQQVTAMLVDNPRRLFETGDG